MPYPLVRQLRFTRSEFRRGLAGVTEAEAGQRFPPMNSISWIVAHLVGQEQRNWFIRMHAHTPLPIQEELAAYGGLATMPELDEMWTAWSTVIPAVALPALHPAVVTGLAPSSPMRLR